MKKGILSIALLICILAALTACNSTQQSLNGTYTDESGSVSYIFYEDGKVDMLYGGELSPRGEFVLEGNQVKIDGVPRGTVKGKVFTETGGVKYTKE